MCFLALGPLLYSMGGAQQIQWQKVYDAPAVQNMSMGNIAVHSNGSVFAAIYGVGVVRSTDGGSHWHVLQDSVSPLRVRHLTITGTGDLYAAPDSAQVLKLLIYDSTWAWERCALSGDTMRISTIGNDPNGYLYVGSMKGVHRSTDKGATWTRQSSRYASDFMGRETGDLFACSSEFTGYGVARSTDAGMSWVVVDSGLAPNNRSIMALGHDPQGALYAGGYPGVMRSVDNGGFWTAMNKNLPTGWSCVYALAVGKDGSLFAGSLQGVSKWKDTSWVTMNTGLQSREISSLAFTDSGYLYAATFSGQIYKTSTPVITEVKSRISPKPQGVVLAQNYPNPFNPSTTIRYGLPRGSHVLLTLFNTLGQQVATLVQGEEKAGYHEVRFDGTGLSSGVYFYQMTAGDYVATKKLLLLK
jgi:photosystem II stability/assembly factor-like uncharacterized protein